MNRQIDGVAGRTPARRKTSKTDTERLLVISPELADVLSTIICRVRDEHGARPRSRPTTTTNGSGTHRCRYCSNAHFGGEHRPIAGPAVRELISNALTGSGITDSSGNPCGSPPTISAES